MKAVSEGIYYQDTYAGVILGAIIFPFGTLLIDSPLRSEDARSWKALIRTQSKGTHRIIVNLDEHTDRNIGNRYMDLNILSHAASYELLNNRAVVFKGQSAATGAEWENYPEIMGARWAAPNLCFTDQLQINWGDDAILLSYRPGPAAGAIWVEVPNHQVVFVGDAVVTEQPPFLGAAHIPTWIETLQPLTTPTYQNHTIISGRSGQITPAEVQQQIAFLAQIQAQLESLAQQDAPVSQTDRLLPDLMAQFVLPYPDQEWYEDRLRFGLREYFHNHFINPTPAND